MPGAPGVGSTPGSWTLAATLQKTENLRSRPGAPAPLTPSIQGTCYLSLDKHPKPVIIPLPFSAVPAAPRKLCSPARPSRFALEIRYLLSFHIVPNSFPLQRQRSSGKALSAFFSKRSDQFPRFATISFIFILFRTLWLLAKTYLLPFQPNPNSCCKTRGVGCPSTPSLINRTFSHFTEQGKRDTSPAPPTTHYSLLTVFQRISLVALAQRETASRCLLASSIWPRRASIIMRTFSRAVCSSASCCL